MEIRKKYINKFIDKECEEYKEFIKKTKRYIDGECYDGYLWDCLFIKELEIIKEKYFNDVSCKIEDVYVFWDIHSCQKIGIDEYWRFDKHDVLRLDFNVLLKGLKYLPEDIYIFDNTYNWTLIYTHEEIDECRYCIKCGKI